MMCHISTNTNMFGGQGVPSAMVSVKAYLYPSKYAMTHDKRRCECECECECQIKGGCCGIPGARSAIYPTYPIIYLLSHAPPQVKQHAATCPCPEFTVLAFFRIIAT